MPVEDVERRIFTLRGHKVMIDSDLAELYGVTPKRLNEQVKRSRRRFPDDFMFQLTVEEAESLRSQFATLKTGRGQHRKYRRFRALFRDGPSQSALSVYALSAGRPTERYR